MGNKFTPEIIEKAKRAKSAEELTALAKENGIELTEDEAKEYFERLNKSDELSDEELDNVAGGGCGGGGPQYAPSRCRYCGGRLGRCINKKTKETWYVCKRCGRYQ